MKYIDFKAVAAANDVAAVAERFVTLKQNRAPCPVCKGSERTLQVFPETNSFRCHTANLSGDSIALYAHLKGIGMYLAAQELSQGLTPPQEPESRKQPAPNQFDATAFAERLTYTQQVSQLGITEEAAKRFGIGFCPKGALKGYVCFPITDGVETHYIGWNGTELKVPKWQSNVVKLRA